MTYIHHAAPPALRPGAGGGREARLVLLLLLLLLLQDVLRGPRRGVQLRVVLASSGLGPDRCQSLRLLVMMLVLVLLAQGDLLRLLLHGHVVALPQHLPLVQLGLALLPLGLSLLPLW